MAQEMETLTQLVTDRVGGDGRMTYRAFETKCVDPKTGNRVSRTTLWKIAKGEPIMVSPEVVNAVAAGLSLPLERVQAAAAYQYTGLTSTATATPLGDEVVFREPGAQEGELTRGTFARWDESDEAVQPGEASNRSSAP